MHDAEPAEEAERHSRDPAWEEEADPFASPHDAAPADDEEEPCF